MLCGRPSGSRSTFSYCQQKGVFFSPGFFFGECVFSIYRHGNSKDRYVVLRTSQKRRRFSLICSFIFFIVVFLFLHDWKRAEESASGEFAAHEYMNNRSLQKKTINLYCFVGTPSGPSLLFQPSWILQLTPVVTLMLPPASQLLPASSRRS